jgi:Sulfotransferase family
VNPYVVIIGCPRSGTTLLRGIVEAHPQIGMLPETRWIPKLAHAGLEDFPVGVL